MLPGRQKTNRTVWTFGTASFLHDMGADMIFSVWPVFLQTTLGASMSVIGIIDGVGEAMVSISQALAGYASDRMRQRKIFIWCGYLLGAVARVGYALSTTWAMVLPFRILDRSGKMRGSPRDAIVSEISVDGNRGRHFGLLRGMDNAGAVTGIILSIIIVQMVPLRTMFLIAAIPSLIAAAVVLLGISERVPGKIVGSERFQIGKIHGNLRLFFFVSALFEIGAFSYSFLLLASGWHVTALPFLYLLFTLVAALCSFPLGRLSDAWGRKNVVLFSFLCWLAVCAIFLQTHHPLAMLLAFALYGLFRAGTDTVCKAFVSELAPPALLATTLGAYQMIVGLCSLPASLIAGILWDVYGIQATFLFSIVMAAAAIVLLTFVHKR